jgi:molybdopterin synthase sulfur carrier subunit
MTEVRLDGYVREFGPPSRTVTARRSVEELLDELESTYPRLRLKLRDEAGELRRFVRIFVNREDVRNGEGLKTPLASTDEVDILHSLQGG